MKKRKPRPRDIFDVQKLISQRENKAIERMETKRKLQLELEAQTLD